MKRVIAKKISQGTKLLVPYEAAEKRETLQKTINRFWSGNFPGLNEKFLGERGNFLRRNAGLLQRCQNFRQIARLAAEQSARRAQETAEESPVLFCLSRGSGRCRRGELLRAGNHGEELFKLGIARFGPEKAEERMQGRTDA